MQCYETFFPIRQCLKLTFRTSSTGQHLMNETVSFSKINLNDFMFHLFFRLSYHYLQMHSAHLIINIYHPIHCVNWIVTPAPSKCYHCRTAPTSSSCTPRGPWGCWGSPRWCVTIMTARQYSVTAGQIITEAWLILALPSSFPCSDCYDSRGWCATPDSGRRSL